MRNIKTIAGAVALAGLLAACGTAAANEPTSTEAPAATTSTEAPTTTAAPTTTSTTEAPTTTVAAAAPVAGKGGAPTDPYVLDVINFYQTAPMGTDLTCRGLAFDRTVMAGAFAPADAPFVVAAITERAVKEGCPIS